MITCQFCGTQYERHKGRDEHSGDPCRDVLAAQLRTEKELRAHQAELLHEEHVRLERLNREVLDAAIARLQAEVERQRGGWHEAYKLVTGRELDSEPCEGGRPDPCTAVIVALHDHAATLRSALELAEECMGYVPTYFVKKWKLAEELAKLQRTLPQ